MAQGVNSALDVRAALRNDRMRRYVYEDFRTPIATFDGDGDGVAGTTGPNILVTGDNIFEYEGVGTMDSAVLIWNADTGLLLTSNMTSDNVGIEINLGNSAGADSTTGLRSKGAFTVGTDDAFGASLNFTLADVSGTDFCFFGFRKAEANQAAEGALTYTDYALLAVISGDIKIYTSLNNGTEGITDTTDNWADTENHTLTVLVDHIGRVTFEIDGVAPTTTTSFTFDNGDVVMPFFRIQNATDIANGTVLKVWESGFQGVGNLVRKTGINNTGGL